MSLTISFTYNYPQVARESGFRLRQNKEGPLDWRLLGALDMERIQRDQQFEQVDGVLHHLSEVPLASLLDAHILDSGIAKYFMLSQFAIQYLLFCRQFLDETVADLRDAYAASQMEVARLKKSHAGANNEILQLHKKITEMEAIHEVVYPCASCTKSFVSNEALNLHMNRKHPTISNNVVRVLPPPNSNERHPDTTISGGDREKKSMNDLSLINTIKLELEIKQLKERLNAAEREIRERSSINSKRTTPRQELPTTATKTTSQRSIGIQSNLIEVKEHDDASSDISDKIPSIRNDQLDNVLEKVRDFEEWRENIRTTNAESLAEINRKLTDLTQAIEVGNANQQNARTEERRPSMGNLEKILSEKVIEIGRASAAKLEEVAYHMEMNYKEKLNELEREIKQQQQEINKTKYETIEQSKNDSPKAGPRKSLQRGQTFAEEKHQSETDSEEVVSPIACLKTERTIQIKSNEPIKTTPEKTSEVDETFIVNLPKKKESLQNKQENNNVTMDLNQSSTDENTNHTFVKNIEQKVEAKILQQKPTSGIDPGDSTDISESLGDEEEETDGSDDTQSNSEPPKKFEKKTKISSSINKVEKRPKTGSKEKPKQKPINLGDKVKEKKLPAKTKEFPRAEAQKLLDDVLQDHGLESRAKTINNASWKRSMAELTERRTLLKEKHPNFYVTRNRIKKFVDRLCSTRTAEKADALLKQKQPLQPDDLKHLPQHSQRLTMESPNLEETIAASQPSTSTALTPISSTPTKDDEKADFKQRLERILSSPLHRPQTARTSTFIADIHHGGNDPNIMKAMPMPVPRKRVMFNTSQSTMKNNQRIYEFGE